MAIDASRNGRSNLNGVGKRSVTPTEQAQQIANDVGTDLSQSFPGWARLKLDCRYEILIQIRDGLVSTTDFSATHGDESRATASDKDVAATIRSVEKWIVQSLPGRLRLGYHGNVTITIDHDNGVIKVRPKIMHQRKYSWVAAVGR